MMSKNKYKDLNVLTIWIDNQRKFERHKRQLNEIYCKLDKKSENELGFQNEMYDKLPSKKMNKFNTSKFVKKGSLKIKKENNLLINSKNKILFNKIESINKRRNVFYQIKKKMKDNEFDLINKSPALRKKSENLRKIKQDSIQDINETLSKRINQKFSKIDLKFMDDQYSKHQYYMNFNRKFELPKIEHIGKHVGSVDNSIFVRKNEDNNYLLAGGFPKYTQTFNRNLSESSKDLKLKNIEDEIKHSSNFVKNRINTNTNYAFLNDTIHNSKKLNNSKSIIGSFSNKNNKIFEFTQFIDTPFEKNMNFKPFE